MSGFSETGRSTACNAVRSYADGSRAAIVIMSPSDSWTAAQMTTAFGLRGAVDSDLEWTAPQHHLDTVGDCVVREDGVLLTVEGGGAFLGMRFETHWGPTDPSWLEAARGEGCVWVCIGPNPVDGVVPPGPALKLEAVFP